MPCVSVPKSCLSFHSVCRPLVSAVAATKCIWAAVPAIRLLRGCERIPPLQDSLNCPRRCHLLTHHLRWKRAVWSGPRPTRVELGKRQVYRLALRRARLDRPPGRGNMVIHPAALVKDGGHPAPRPAEGGGAFEAGGALKSAVDQKEGGAAVAEQSITGAPTQNAIAIDLRPFVRGVIARADDRGLGENRTTDAPQKVARSVDPAALEVAAVVRATGIKRVGAKAEKAASGEECPVRSNL